MVAAVGSFGGIGKGLIVLGLVLLVVGGLFLLAARFGITRLPGDIVVKRDNFTFYAPLGLMILLSIILTIVLNVIGRR